MSNSTQSRFKDCRVDTLLSRLTLLLMTATLSACGGCPKAQKAWDSAKMKPVNSKPGPHWMLEVQTKDVRSRLLSARNKKKFSKS